MRGNDNTVDVNGRRTSAGPSSAPVPPNGSGRVRQYEDLDGSLGREVFFRPQRYTAADLAPLRGLVTVFTPDAPRDCELVDVSQNGAAFVWPLDAASLPRERLEIGLRFDSHAAFHGAARVGSMREQDGLTVVGVSFDDFLLDIDEVLQLRSVQAWASGGAAPRARGKPWAIHGCERYKSLVADLRLLLEDAQRELAAIEAKLPWHVLHGADNPARAALVFQLRSEFVVDVVSLTEEIDSAVRELPQGHRDPAAREWSRRYVEEFLLQSPGNQRARAKPFGYPGDYEVMNFIYERPFEGSSLFGRAVQLAFWHSRSAIAVRARKDLVKRELKALLSRHAGSKRPLRVLSIASGPAQELAELFDEVAELPAPLEVVLFEQDKNALAHAWRRLAPARARFPGDVRIMFLHDSIKRLLRDAELFSPFGEFDLIYSAGLLDYLQQRTAVVLTRHLAKASAPGGQLLIANMVDHPAHWYLEVPLEWPLVYRTREDLLDVGRRAVPGAVLEVLEDASGANPFLRLTPG
jgi:extracellular factor (EF) 3-hydroxypalmitic acid methyl ester biosynthesis protein